MWFRAAADAVLVLHLAFIAFALAGAALTVRWPWIPLVHLPAAGWGIFVELSGRICPLTYLENHLRIEAGQSGYTDSFIEHYLLDIIYPAGLGPDLQWLLAAVVAATNAAIYAWLLHRWRRGPRRPA